MPPAILIVDEDPGARRRLREILQLEGYDAASASSALEAMMAAASSHRPVDLVLIDANLRGISGPALAGKMEQALPQTRVIYIAKPVIPGDLVAQVREALDSIAPRKMTATTAEVDLPKRESA